MRDAWKTMQKLHKPTIRNNSYTNQEFHKSTRILNKSLNCYSNAIVDAVNLITTRFRVATSLGWKLTKNLRPEAIVIEFLIDSSFLECFDGNYGLT